VLMEKGALLQFDIEHAAQEGQALESCFKQCSRPLILLEGITYFLSPSSRDWLIDAIKDWSQACIVMDYWPMNSLEISAKLKSSFERNLNQDFKEKLKSFMPDKSIAELKAHYNATDISIGKAEAQLSSAAGEQPLLADQNEYYPIRIFTGMPKNSVAIEGMADLE